MIPIKVRVQNQILSDEKVVITPSVYLTFGNKFM